MNPSWRDSELQHTVAAGTWIERQLGRFPTTAVGSLVPLGYEAYARIVRPAESVDEKGNTRWVRWSDIARSRGTIAHAAMEWSGITAGAPQGFLRTDPPEPTSLVSCWEDQVVELAALSRHFTETADDCWFAFWEGNTAFEGISPTVPKLQFGSFNHYLFRGAVERASEDFRGLSPNAWWPEDRSWFVSAHVDFPSVYVGGSEAYIRAVVNNVEFEAWTVASDQPITSDSDHLNI
ncbi:hypothetical protein IEU95_09045 [Hoyosella rhizosphaerae]|uniref:Uncharacterized protein n=1 Tax=Hoyosella rhizosphaerae TaxID=1755582 RepID=A0A916U2W7_9ACTN|nr:hypothetical protein [Hoyosella rhizosphaerae]MBN4926977.1 hypothetical protein [Hoyosella rhizosphaerae]GGC54998.1 hypothetical protein GCM10011410_04250 [Hoyosella rhizosphaerae]